MHRECVMVPSTLIHALTPVSKNNNNNNYNSKNVKVWSLLGQEVRELLGRSDRLQPELSDVQETRGLELSSHAAITPHWLGVRDNGLTFRKGGRCRSISIRHIFLPSCFGTSPVTCTDKKLGNQPLASKPSLVGLQPLRHLSKPARCIVV